MDTVEELNGTYFYDGSSNLSAGELFFWIMIDETLEHFGISDIAAIYSRKLFRDRMLPIGLPTWVGFPPKVNMIMTKRLGTFVGRTIPVVGWVILAADVSSITYKTVSKYNIIARPSDRLW